jgi:hypothetical protein
MVADDRAMYGEAGLPASAAEAVTVLAEVT